VLEAAGEVEGSRIDSGVSLDHKRQAENLLDETHCFFMQ
jgi:hypothetical protein